MNAKRGYTLVEMLAAIAVIGLTLSGLTQATRLIGAYQQRSGDSLRKAEHHAFAASSLRALALQSGGTDLEGNTKGFSAKCEGLPCSLALSAVGRSITELKIVGPGAGIFVLPSSVSVAYQTTSGLRDRWPVTDPYERLTGIAIANPRGSILAYAPLRQFEAPGCEYDVISLSCRTKAAP